MGSYVHGYSKKESTRLSDQASTLTGLLHEGTQYAPGCKVLEAGCGTGSQTTILAANSPEASFTSIDLSKKSLQIAQDKLTKLEISNVTLNNADIFNLPYPDQYFDHIFICFVLEHLQKSVQALRELKRVLKISGTITIIEGDHGSFYCYPQTKEAMQVVHCLINIQASSGGNSLIGRQLYPLLKNTGYLNIKVTPKMVYVDDSRPDLIEGFSKNTFIAMVEGIKEKAISNRQISDTNWDKGIADLYKATREGSTFCYTFFKATACN